MTDEETIKEQEAFIAHQKECQERAKARANGCDDKQHKPLLHEDSRGRNNQTAKGTTGSDNECACGPLVDGYIYHPGNQQPLDC